MIRKTFIQTLAICFLAACSTGPQTERDDNKNKRNSTLPSPIAQSKGAAKPEDQSNSERVGNPPSVGESGKELRLVGYVKGEIPLEETRVYVLGTDHSTAANAEGQFILDGYWVKDLKSVSLYALKEHKGKTYGSIINDVKFAKADAEGKDQGLKLTESVPEIPLTETGSIKGVIQLKDSDSSIGIDVYLPGTKFTAKTDEKGNVYMDGIPSGVWPNGIQLEKVGYVSKNIKDVDIPSGGEFVISNDTVELDVDLRLNTGDITLADGAAESKSKSVKVSLAYPSQVTRMMLSENETFVNIKWTKVKKTTTYDFKNNGNVTLFVKFSDAAGLETAPISASINIDAMTDEEKKKACEQDPSKVYFQGECVPRTFYTDCKNPAPAHTATVNALKDAVGKSDCQEAYDALVAIEGKIDISGKNITDLTPVRGILSKLKEIDISGNPVEKLEPLAGLSSLEVLHAANTIVTDSKEFRHASGLKELNIENVPVSSFTGLASMQIQSLTVGGPYMSTISDLSTVSTIKSLTINNTVFENAQFLPIASMPGLNHLMIANTEKDRGKLSEIPFASKLTQLSTLVIKHHQVKDLSPLAELKLSHVNLTGNAVEDASKINPEDLTVAILRSNKISNVEWLEKGSKLVEADISGNPVYYQLQSLAPHKGLVKFAHDTGKIYDSMCPTKDSGKGLIAFCSNAANVISTPVVKMQYHLSEGKFDCRKSVEVKFEGVPGIKNELRVHAPFSWIVDGKEVEGHEWVYAAGKKVEIKNDCQDGVLKIEAVSGSKGAVLYNQKIGFYHNISYASPGGSPLTIFDQASAYESTSNKRCRYFDLIENYNVYSTYETGPKYEHYTIFNGEKDGSSWEFLPSFSASTWSSSTYTSMATRHAYTHQNLYWLAIPIQLDADERVANFVDGGNYHYVFDNKEEEGTDRPGNLIYNFGEVDSVGQWSTPPANRHFRFVSGKKYWLVVFLHDERTGYQPASNSAEVPFGSMYVLASKNPGTTSLGNDEFVTSHVHSATYTKASQSHIHEVEFRPTHGHYSMFSNQYTSYSLGYNNGSCQGSFVPTLEFSR